ncbi:phi13 family phage major tail protein [Pullulanibacillus pueri]|uniref:Tail protein n=1 Tax=Pullulanibacillus pueri TaxID=1437324 RepID=A0A8J2ZWF1_9BACL|nr:major tail protein [Pullulanibacillus pueri]MBM7681946.1 phi13 family phage major tail protein [Pullulanibacillus pueri]GGH83548.1 tail protein [Pullulanibacillus pueri]
MATVGFKSAKIAVLDENEKTSADNIFTADEKTAGAIEAAITGLAPTQNVVYASNVPYYVSSKGTGDIKIALTVADLEALPEGALDKILGREKNEDGITTIGANTEAPYCAVGLYTDDKNGKALFIGLLKVKFTFDGDDIKSTDNNGSTLSSDVLNGSGVSRASDGLSWAKAREADDVTQDQFEDFIFPIDETPDA